MTDSVKQLQGIPDADTVTTLRDRASNEETSVQVTYPGPDGNEKRLVVSSRGTCVVLGKTREKSFIPSVDAADVAEALQQ